MFPRGQQTLSTNSNGRTNKQCVWAFFFNHFPHTLEVPELIRCKKKDRARRNNSRKKRRILVCDVNESDTWNRSFFLGVIFEWRILALQCCVSFCYIAVQTSYISTCILSLSSLLSTSHPWCHQERVGTLERSPELSACFFTTVLPRDLHLKVQSGLETEETEALGAPRQADPNLLTRLQGPYHQTVPFQKVTC